MLAGPIFLQPHAKSAFIITNTFGNFFDIVFPTYSTVKKLLNPRLLTSSITTTASQYSYTGGTDVSCKRGRNF